MSPHHPPMPDEPAAIAMALAPFHVAVVEYCTRPDGPDVIRGLIATVTLLGLGNMEAPGGPAPAPAYEDARGGGPTVSLVHFFSEGREYLPLWSDPNALIHAGQTNPEWSNLQPILLSGDGIQTTMSPEVWIVINPWTELEISIPPAGGS